MKPRQKFVVGEEVRVFSPSEPDKGVECTEVTAVTYGQIKGYDESTWVYQTVDIGRGEKWVPEEYLHKLPPSERVSWEDCAFQPTSEVMQ